MRETAELRQWLATGTGAIKRARGRLDAINVFPVADSDTGTNIYLTLREGNRAVSELSAQASHREVVAAFVRGALLGARGNSGVIVSAYLAEFLSAVDAHGGLADADGAAIADALDSAAGAAWGAVSSPVEGTILTVAREAATSALEASRAGVAREGVLVAAVVGARASLVRTQADLPAAREAGVVDAGAAGLVLQLEMLAETLGGPHVLDAIDEVDWELDDAHEHPHGVVETGFEVMFAAHSQTDLRHALSPRLAAIGDSVAVTGAQGLWQAHVHTERPGEAVKVAASAPASHIVVRSLDDHAGDEAQTVVALTTCPGLADALAEAGAIVVVVPHPTDVSRKEVKRALRGASGRAAVVVAGEPELFALANKVAGERRRPHLTVLDARHEAHVLVAVAAAALATPGEDRIAAMRAAIASTAVTESSGDALDDDVDRLVNETTEVVTLILGRGVNPAVADAVRLSVAAAAPTADVAVYEGDQAWPPISVGVENASD